MMPITLWFTGLSGSGKSTIAEKFIKRKPDWVLLDGDVLRSGLCEDLGFSIDDRKENMRRLRHICKLFNDNGKSIITSFISPLEIERINAKNELENCYIVFIYSDLETCENRDVKGLYKKARNGDILNFTGINSPFEYPHSADLILETKSKSVDECIHELEEFVNSVIKDKTSD